MRAEPALLHALRLEGRRTARAEGRRPSSGAAFFGASSPSAPPAAALAALLGSICCSRCCTNESTKLAMFPKENLPCIFGSNFMPAAGWRPVLIRSVGGEHHEEGGRLVDAKLLHHRAVLRGGHAEGELAVKGPSRSTGRAAAPTACLRRECTRR